MRRMFWVAVLALGVAATGRAAEQGEIRHYLEQAEVVASLGMNDSALAIANTALIEAESRFGFADSLVAEALTMIGRYQMKLGAFSEADSAFSRALTTSELLFAYPHPRLAEALTDLATAHTMTGKLADAESLLKRAIKAYENPACNDDRGLAKSLKTLADTKRRLNAYTEARDLYLRSLVILQTLDTDQQENLASVLASLASVELVMSNYLAAESLLESSISMLDSKSEHDSLIRADMLYNLGITQKMLGKLDLAERSYRETALIWEEIKGESDPTTAYALHALANLYLFNGEYSASEPLFRRTLEIWSKALGANHALVGGCMKNLATLYRVQGNVVEAESLYLAALTIREKAVGANDPDVAKVLNELANLYRELGRYQEAETLLRRSESIYEEKFGTDHASWAVTLGSLAMVYRKQGRLAEALEIYERVLPKLEATHGREHPNVAACLQSIGDVLLQQGRYEEVGVLFEEMLAINEKTAGPLHPVFAGSLEASSVHLMLTGNRPLALDEAVRAFRIRRGNFISNVKVLSEADALLFAGLMRRSADNCLSIALQSSDSDSHSLQAAAEVILASKGAVSDEIFLRRQSIGQSDDSETRRLAASYFKARNDLSKLFVKSASRIDPAKHRTQMASLSARVDLLESELGRKSARFRESLEANDVSCDRISPLIPDDCLLVEFLKYRLRDYGSDNWESRYLVMTMSKSDEPTIKDLGPASTLDSLVASYREHLQGLISLWPGIGDKALQQGHDLFRRLYNFTIAPIEDQIAGHDMVLIAPDGALNLVSFAGLMNDEGHYFVEKTLVHYVSSGRDLLRFRQVPEKGSGLLAIGNPDYFASAEERRGELGEDSFPGRSQLLSSQLDESSNSVRGLLLEGEVTPLPFTEREVLEISERWRAETGELALCLTGVAASEENFKRQASGWRVIHLATHGFFHSEERNDNEQAEEKEDREYLATLRPMLRSGLLLAGANVSDESPDIIQSEDAILTAEEVAMLNLVGTDWVVLSACESGLGEVRSGEGVYGLRRAFLLAGARTVISSLWSVPDKETARFMSELYSSVGSDVATALNQIMLRELNRQREIGLPDHPLNWGAFVAVGSPRH